MGLLNVIRSGVKIANSVTRPLQATVSYKRATTDGYGARTYAAAVALRALVDEKAVSVRSASGDVVVCRATVTFLDVAALSTATGGVGIHTEDQIILPDGATCPVVQVGGFVDAGTGQPFATDAYLG